MATRIVKISHIKGQNLVGIPKKLAIAGGFDKAEYAKIWLTEGNIIHVKGLRSNGDKERDV